MNRHLSNLHFLGAFDTELHRVMLSILHLQTVSAGSSAPYLQSQNHHFQIVGISNHKLKLMRYVCHKFQTANEDFQLLIFAKKVTLSLIQNSTFSNIQFPRQYNICAFKISIN